MLENYNNMTDETLASLAQHNDREAEDILIRRYVELIRGKAHLYFIVGADGEDVIQEGMIGLFKAIHDYSKDKEASFKTFAQLCINRQILTAVKTASRLKHRPLNNSVSLSAPVDENDRTALEELLRGDMTDNPEAVLMANNLSELIAGGDDSVFSKMELDVLEEYLAGRKYSEIARSQGKSYKSVDNAMQRIRKKISDYMNN